MGFDKGHHLTLRRLQPARIARDKRPTLVSIRLTPALAAALQRLTEGKRAGWQDAPSGQSSREETPRDNARGARRSGDPPGIDGPGRSARPMRK